MKTTVDISDAVLTAARELAKREKTSVKALIERGLRSELAKAECESDFRLRRVSVGGKGLRRDNPQARWDSLRELAYTDQKAG